MVKVNFLIVLVTAIIPMVMGFIWYNPKTFGAAWAKEAGMTEEKMKGANMALVFGLSFLFSFLMAFALQFMVIHQWGVFSSLATDPKAVMDPATPIGTYFADFMAKYGNNFRTFKHGALHGFLGGLMIALPIIGTNALFERKSFKYIAINVGYWTITMCLMGGVLCAFS